MIKLVWLSRHELNDTNKKILQQAFEKYHVFHYRPRIKDIQDVIDFADLMKADAYIVVLPDHQLYELFRRERKRRKIYRFIVDRVVNEKGQKEFVPKGLEVIKEYVVKTRRIV